MKRINKIILLNIVTFLPLTTLIACSSTKQPEPINPNPGIGTQNEQLFTIDELNTDQKTDEITIIKVKISKTPEDSESQDFILSIKENNTTSATEINQKASTLENQWLEFKFSNKLKAKSIYQLLKIKHKNHSINFPNEPKITIDEKAKSKDDEINKKTAISKTIFTNLGNGDAAIEIHFSNPQANFSSPTLSLLFSKKGDTTYHSRDAKAYINGVATFNISSLELGVTYKMSFIMFGNMKILFTNDEETEFTY